MEAIIKIEDRKTFQSLVQFLRSLNIEVISRQESRRHKEINKNLPDKKEEDFFAICGIWEGRNIDKETLRKKAWRH